MQRHGTDAMTGEANERLARIEDFLVRHGLGEVSMALADQALTHRSYAFEHDGAPDNERLEFLGDAVVGCAASDYLFRRYPDEPEGQLSKKKAFIVSRAELGRRAEEIGLHSLVLLGRGEESSGGRRRSSIVGSALEALVGALYLSLPYPVVSEFVCDHILAPIACALQSEAHLDSKSRLQEFLQKRGRELPVYRIAEERGPPHSKVFVIEALIEGRPMGRGEGSRVKTAENEAARAAYEALEKD